MKVTAFNKYTGEKIYEIELKECRIEHIADVARNVRLGECWAHMNEIPIRREYENENDEFIAGVRAGIAAAAYSGYRPFDIGDYVVYQRNGECQLGRVAGFGIYDREKVFVRFNKGCTASAANIADLFPATVTEQGPRRPRRKIARISSLRRLMSGLHARALLYILSAVR